MVAVAVAVGVGVVVAVGVVADIRDGVVVGVGMRPGKHCRHCGTRNRLGALSCRRCGRRFDDWSVREMRKLTIVFVLALFGCEGEPQEFPKTEYDCSETSKEVLAEFTLTCLKNANPLSDEEPEDWMDKCPRMATRTYCKAETYMVLRRGGQPYGPEISRRKLAADHE